MPPDNNTYIPRLLSIIILLTIGCLVYFFFSPEEYTLFPKCPFHQLTGFDCPGCGSQRAIHHLLHLNLRNAFISNPLLIIAIPYLILGFYFEYFGGKQKYPQLRRALFGKTAIIAVLSIIIIFGIGRNVFSFYFTGSTV